MKRIHKLFIVFGICALLVCAVQLRYVLSQGISLIDAAHFSSAPNKKTDVNSGTKSHVSKPEHVKGVYMSSWVAGSKSVRDPLTNLIYDTEINSVIIDFKDSSGIISIPAGPDASPDRSAAASRRALGLKEYIDELHAHDVYVIARLATFQDPVYSKRHPGDAVQTSDGGIWIDRHGLSWVDASSEPFRTYMLDLSLEAYELGFDEINLDYIRFPTDGKGDKIFPISQNKKKQDVITEFLVFMKDGLSSKDIPLSIDIFGQVVTDRNDMDIGQYYEDLVVHVDAISPMIYPSHFYPGYKNLSSPERSPYETIRFSLSDALNRKNTLGVETEIRPWLQDFSVEIPYGKAEVVAQIQAAHDLGIDSFLLWDPKNRYTKEALIPTE